LVEFQIFQFPSRIGRLTSHFELHPKDYLFQTDLRKILEKRQKLLSYLSIYQRKMEYGIKN